MSISKVGKALGGPLNGEELTAWRSVLTQGINGVYHRYRFTNGVWYYQGIV